METSNIEGIINISSKAVGYVKNIETGEDIVIETADLNCALNGDRVRVQILAKIPNEAIKGEVVHIISRARDQFVGTVNNKDNNTKVLPDNRRIHVSFILSAEDAAKVKENDKVLVKMLEWKNEKEIPRAQLLKIFGQKGIHEVEIQSIIYEKGFQSDFPADVEAEAKKLKSEWLKIPDSEIAKRRDVRDRDIFTIDPFDAKDFDDALHIVDLPNGNYEIGVHIADVSHFVTPGTKLDEEAHKRAFSVYLVDRTIPMLPEILSNELCSLNPNEEKLAFSAIFEMDKDANIVSRWFGKTVMKSVKRFNYEEAQAVMDANSGPYVAELLKMNALAKIMQAKNKTAGAISFDSQEIKFELDKNGHPIRIIKKQPLDTHKLVEEFMLLANREVAKFIYDQNEKVGGNDIGLMYRIHDVPNPEKISQLATFLKALGYTLPVNKDGSITARDLNELFDKVNGKAEEGLVKSASVKTMSKAIYSTENLGHFGLAFEYYTHFTSPIRRYPDLLVHRILQKFLTGEKLQKDELYHFKESADRSSQQEVSAADAERDSIKYKQAEYMMDHIGQIYDGVISGVSAWGIYVMVNDTLSEGMVHISKLGNDFFQLDENNYAIVGEKTKARFSLGDTVKIKVEKIDLDKKNIDFSLVKDVAVPAKKN